MEKNEKVEFWLNSARKDWQVLEYLYKGKKYADALFYGHLVLEKVLKAVYIERKDGPPPFVHDLLYLARKTELNLTEDLEKDLKIITGFNINARYDDYKKTFYYEATKEYTIIFISKIKEIKVWLEDQISKR